MTTRSGTSPEPDIELVTVLATGDAGIVAIAKSILQSAEVPFVVVGEHVQDLFGWGRFPGRMNVVVGMIEIRVRPEDASDAAEMLRQLAGYAGPEDD